MTLNSKIILIILLSWFIITGCEPFEPLQENERHFFSINGYVDASADTQWVRVMPVRESLNMEPGLEIPDVTLLHTESGESVIMKDSLFEYYGDRYTYNFWTTMKIDPEQTYQITVEGQDGRYSRAEATLPEDFPDPHFKSPEFDGDILLIEQVQHLADVKVTYRLLFNTSGEIYEWVFPHLRNSTLIPPDTYRAAIDAGAMRTKIIESYCDFTITERTVFVASGGPDWPDFLSLDNITVALPDGEHSNIENGVGFFGGIISKTIPYVDWSGDDGLERVPCP